MTQRNYQQTTRYKLILALAVGIEICFGVLLAVIAYFLLKIGGIL